MIDILLETSRILQSVLVVSRSACTRASLPPVALCVGRRVRSRLERNVKTSLPSGAQIENTLTTVHPLLWASLRAAEKR
jgi:hypothetical protein